MSKLYFIDHESIKKTAKAIKRQNFRHKYTYILDELTKCLGYTSYNDYEHYLTNAFLNSDENLTKITPLTKAYIPELISLSNKILDSLSEQKIEASNIHFIDKIIIEKENILKKHSVLNFKSYIYYLPFVFNSYENIINSHILKIEKLDSLLNTMRTYYLNLECITFNNNDYQINMDLKELKILSESNLKLRGLYYSLLFKNENILYSEAFVVNLILSYKDNEYIISEITNELNNNNERYNTVNPLIKTVIQENDYINIFPHIKNNISESQPLVLGVNDIDEPVYINKTTIFENVNIFGTPGSGRGILEEVFMFNSLIHNKGFLYIDYVTKKEDITHNEKKIKHIGSLFNRQDDAILIQENKKQFLGDYINNNKIINLSLIKPQGNDDDVKIHQSAQIFQLFDIINNYYYKSKFRKGSLPYYIIISGCKDIIEASIIEKIEQLNRIGIFIIFNSDTLHKYNIIFKHVLMPNLDVDRERKTSAFPFKNTPVNIWSPYGPTRKGTTFSHYFEGSFKQQLWLKISHNYDTYYTNVRSTL